MAYSAQQLITRAWYLSGIVGRGFQTPTGDQITDGLYLLNALLDFKQIETDLIPYYQYIVFDATNGQENYFLPYVAEIESCTFNLGVVRYPMVSQTRRNYYGSARVDNIETLPFSYNYDRSLGGGNLSLYFIPDQPYPIKMQVKLFLTDVSLNTDLTNIFPPAGSNFTALKPTKTFTVSSGIGGALVINSQLTVCFGEEVQFVAGTLGLPSTLSPSTTYFASPINAGTFNVATSLANAQAGNFILFATGNGSVTSFSLVITLSSPVNITLGQQVIFTTNGGTLPTGLTQGVIYYATPINTLSFCVSTTLIDAQSGILIPFTDSGVGLNEVSILNPNNIIDYTHYEFIHNSSQGLDTSYIEYLRYALAQYMCSEFGVLFNPEAEKKLTAMKHKLMYLSPPDLSMKKVTILTADRAPGYNWGDVNIGRGWRA